MKRKSAGILLYKIKNGTPYFFLVHPGGPFWKNKDLHSWSIPKGEIEKEEKAFETALREFEEETGKKISSKQAIPLTPITQKGGKKVYAWAIEDDLDPVEIKSNLVEIEWPPKSGKKISIPEVDKAGWFTKEEAKNKINTAQYALIEDLMSFLKNKEK